MLGCTFGLGQRLRLSGPGISAPRALTLGGLPVGFWELRDRACRFPLGWDVFFIADNQLVGLPRSTKVEIR